MLSVLCVYFTSGTMNYFLYCIIQHFGVILVVPKKTVCTAARNELPLDILDIAALLSM